MDLFECDAVRLEEKRGVRGRLLIQQGTVGIYRKTQFGSDYGMETFSSDKTVENNHKISTISI